MGWLGLFDVALLARLGVDSSGAWRNGSYDMWSLGVLLLELILGTRDLYHVDDRRWWKEVFQLLGSTLKCEFREAPERSRAGGAHRTRLERVVFSKRD